MCCVTGCLVGWTLANHDSMRLLLYGGGGYTARLVFVPRVSVAYSKGYTLVECELFS